VVLACLVAYVSIYTWNAKTGFLDRFVVATGLEMVGGVLTPGKRVHHEVTAFWERYLYLVGVRQENESLRRELDELRMDLDRIREKEREAARLKRLLAFTAPSGWQRTGARVVGHRLGISAALNSLLIDKGRCSDVLEDTPVIVPQGVVGRVHRPGLHFSSVLLVTDPNSHIPVMGVTTRIPAIVEGQGDDRPLLVKYVPLNDTMPQGEILVTSGLGGMFPKGLPVARVTEVTCSPISLFQHILAQPLIRPRMQEELLLLLPEVNATCDGDEAAPGTVSGQGAGVS
jgi:rod shape-determining protein MreC